MGEDGRDNEGGGRWRKGGKLTRREKGRKRRGKVEVKGRDNEVRRGRERE